MKALGALTVLFGLGVIASAWLLTGTNLQYAESALGVLTLIAGALSLK